MSGYAGKDSVALVAVAAAALAFCASLRAADVKPETCIACHAKESPSIVAQWKTSGHARGDVTCLDCHTADKADADAHEH